MTVTTGPKRPALPGAAKPAQATQSATPAEKAAPARPALPGRAAPRPGLPLLNAKQVQETHLSNAPVRPWTYEEIISEPQNEALIAAQVAEIRRVMLEKGLEPAKTGMTFLVDTTGHQVSVCLACGVEGHNFRPTMVRRANPEINMLDEFVSVTREIANRVGMNYSIVAYDEEVLPLREFGPPTNTGETELKRFQMFRERHPDLKKTIVDGVVQAWMNDEIKKWNPSDATRKVVGEPADQMAFSAAERLLATNPGGLKGVVVAKAKAPVSIRPIENVLAAKQIRAAGVAVGQEAQQAAAMMFRNTIVTPDMHGLRTKVGPSVVSMME